MKHAIFIAFHYPPEASSSGVLRTLKFTKYLPEFGWRVTVITPNVDAYEVVDCALEAQIPSEVRVVRTSYLNSKKHFSIKGRYPVLTAIPDRWIGWYPWATAAGRNVQDSDEVDLVYSTSPHATAHVIGASLAKRCGCPLVIDFRDPWYETPPEPGTPYIRHLCARFLEKKLVKRAKRVIASTNQLKNMLVARYPEQNPDKFRAILNGYDEGDFQFLDTVNHRVSPFSETLTIVHAGSINAEFRDPRPFLIALKECAIRLNVQASQINVRFIGPGNYAESREMKEFLQSNSLQDYVGFIPRMSYKDALRELRSADLLLLLQESDDTRSLVPAKLYEYLRIQKPVLALVLSGAVSEILDETGGAWSVSSQDTVELGDTMDVIINLWKQEKLSSHHASLHTLVKFDRRNLTRQLSKIFDELVE